MSLTPMEEFFDLSPSSPAEETPVKTKEQLISDVKELYQSLSAAEKVEQALPLVVGLEEHDNDMDSIAAKAVKTYEDLMTLGGNVSDREAGKFYEVGIQSLRLSFEAKNAKAEKKLRMLELQMKKVRLDQIDFEHGNGDKRNPNGGEFDRNELLKYIVASKSDKSDK